MERHPNTKEPQQYDIQKAAVYSATAHTDSAIVRPRAEHDATISTIQHVEVVVFSSANTCKRRCHVSPCLSSCLESMEVL